jgi:hypothetical protein
MKTVITYFKNDNRQTPKDIINYKRKGHQISDNP